MNKLYEFKQRVLEEEIFEKLKDSVVVSSHELRRRYKNVDITRLRTKIINYQIETYGEEIGVGRIHPTREENKRLARMDAQRRYYYRNRG